MARFTSAGVIALCMIAWGTGTVTLAQNATSIGGSPACVDVATPAVETVLEEAYGAGTVPARPLAEAPVSVDSLPQGEPADASTVAAANQVVQTWVACILSGQGLAVMALQSDQMNEAFVGHHGQDPDVFELYLTADLQATPAPLDPQAMISDAHDVRVLDNGRIGGIWDIGGNAAFIILTQQDGAWVIDNVIDVIDEATPTP